MSVEIEWNQAFPEYTLKKNEKVDGDTLFLRKNDKDVICPFMTDYNTSTVINCNSNCAKFRIAAEREKDNLNKFTGRLMVNQTCGSGISVILHYNKLKPKTT
jgi:hypothetical protein